MKAKTLLIWLTGISTLTITSCTKSSDTDDTTEGNWILRSSFEGYGRSEAVAFSIGNKGYVVTGYDGSKRLKDLWQYDAEFNFWQQKAEFPGVARHAAAGFAIDTKGYIGTGSDGYNKLKDFWEYDSEADQWTPKEDFGGSGRYSAVGFSIAGKGYITTGYDGNYLKDIWEFDPNAGPDGTWTQRVSMSGEKRMGAVAFVHDNKAYVVTGVYSGGTVNDFNVFDPTKPEGQAWSTLRKISNVSEDAYDDDYNIVRSKAVAFIMNNKAYIATGQNGSVYKDTWEYDFVTDTWKSKTAFEGAARSGACAFSLNNRGFVLLGTTSTSSTQALEDIREFFPDQEYNEYEDQ
ncbi:MAG: Kelch repeat-containing protein [Agriterribacter sp.]